LYVGTPTLCLQQLTRSSATADIARIVPHKPYYCKTLNVCVPFISRAKQNCEIEGREYQLQAKNRTKLLQYFELYGFNSTK